MPDSDRLRSKADLGAEGIGRATLTLKTASPKGSFIGSVTQISSPDRIVEYIPLLTSNPPAFAPGSYPLRWDEDYTNLVTVTNTAEETLRIGGIVTAGDAVYVLTRKDIAPGSTIVFDVDQWKRDGVPDINGAVLPKNAPYGKIHWIEMSNGKKAGLLGRTSLSSVSNRRKSSFSCGSTCQYNFINRPFFDPDLSNFFTIGYIQTSALTEFDSLLNGTSYTYPFTYYDGTVRTDTSGILSVTSDNNSSSNVVLHADGSGNTTIRSDFYDTEWYYDPPNEVCVQTDNYVEQQGPVSVAPKVTFSPVPDIPQGGTTAVVAAVTNAQGQALPNNTIPIHLTLTVNGTGSATFADGSTDLTITSGTTVVIYGVAASGTQNNIVLDARIATADGSSTRSIASPSMLFTVVNVVLSLQTFGSISLDNGSFDAFGYIGSTSGTYLYADGNGHVVCGTPYQITGVVTPSNYTNTITLRRKDTYSSYENGVAESSATAQEDTSPSSLLDSIPQSGGSNGKVYDLDAPGTFLDSSVPVGTIRRSRTNFTEYAVLGGPSSTQHASSNLTFYSRTSCKQTNVQPYAAFEGSIRGDNQMGLGTTPLSENLQ